uniref:Putative methyltransferase NNMT/PNMT/TEMT isoform b n=1 Tax=Dictyocaulus viviparus TaxID=29172 RepID=Q53CN1_DICVI|nr:putative methyltransferase NNMT/PNMT/TEMT isoform b [Dictyocaulus viviparus]
MESADGENLKQAILDRDTFHKEFNTEAYLKDFYTKVEDSAMQMVLIFLPNIVARIGKIKRVLDFGAGPTIHVAASFRNQAVEIYLADYLPQNRQELMRWYEGSSSFDWSHPMKMILTQEGNPWNDLDEMIRITRQKVRGIFHCDCFSSPSVDVSEQLQGMFDTVVTIFCVEYCCKTYDEYKNAIKNITQQIREGDRCKLSGVEAAQ